MLRTISLPLVLVLFGLSPAAAFTAAPGESAAPATELPTLESILQRYVEASGGRAALERLTGRQLTGSYVEELGYREPPRRTASLEASFQAPDRWRIETSSETEVSAMGCDGTRGWRSGPGRVEAAAVNCRSLTAFLLDPRGPLRLDDYFANLTLEKRVSLRDAEAYEVSAVQRDGSRRTLYFDVDSGLLVQAGYHRRLLDYREVDGVAVPFRVEIGRKGGWSAYEFDTARHVEMEDSMRFAPPDPSALPEDPFAGIEDARVLPMLRDLPFTHGGMNVPAPDGRLLHDLIVRKGYTRGLEIGTSNGYSTLWLGLAFRTTGGRVITIEVEPRRAEEARANFRAAGLDEVIDARTADAFEEIRRIEGKLDFVFLDAWKPDYVKFWNLLRDRIAPGGAFTAHNVISQEGSMRAFLDAIREDPEFDTVVRRASREGVSISIRRR